MTRLSFLDSAFLMAENRETPMHVGGINLFTMPANADSKTFLHDLSDRMKDVKHLQPIFGDKLRTGPLGVFGPMYFEPDKEVDLSYHIRHSALPKPGRYRELFELVVKTAAGTPTKSEALGHREFTLAYKLFKPLGPACFPA